MSAAIEPGFNSQTFGPNDDGSYPCTGQNAGVPAGCSPTTVALPLSADFFGTTYSGVYINNNGNLTFSAALSQYTPAPLYQLGTPIIAPFWADVDTRTGNTVTFGTGSIGGHNAFGVNWPGVGCYSINTSVLDNFQVVLIDRSDTGSGNFDIEFNYGQIQWDSGQASGGDANCQNGVAAFAGFAVGTSGSQFYQLPGSGVDGAFLDTNTNTGLVNNDFASTQLGRYVYSFRGGNPAVTPIGGPLSTGETYGGGDPSSSCTCTAGAASAQPTVAGPVNTATGDLTLSATDLEIPGAGPDLSLSRTYDAGLAQAQLSSTSTPSALGYGWAYNLGMRVAYDPTMQLATVVQENGSTIAFSPTGSSSPAWCSSSANFCPQAPRVLASLQQNSDGSWTFVRRVRSAETFTFSTAGQLTGITDAVGNSVSASAQSPGTGQCPSSAATCTVWSSTSSGRSLTLVFDSSARLTAGIATGGETVSFCYWGDPCAATTPAGESGLYSANDPGGLSSTYTYDAANPATQLRSDMTASVDPAGLQEMNSFDTSGRVAQQSGASGTVTFAYTGAAATSSGGTTTVTVFPAGMGAGGVASEVSTYQYSSGVLVAETTGAGSSASSTTLFGRDPVSLLNLHLQDANGNLSTATFDTFNNAGATPYSSADITYQTDAAGNTSETRYTAFNLPWCHVAPAEHANGVACPTSQPAGPPAPGASDPWPGATISFYDGNQHLVAQTDAVGATSSWSFTPAGLSVPAGLPYCSLDPVHYASGVTCPAYEAAHVVGTVTATFDASGDKLTATDGAGDVTTNVYADPVHPWLVTKTTDADGTATTFAYDSAGRLLTSTAAFRSYQAVTRYAYDSAGRRFCKVDPLESAKGIACPTSPPAASAPPAGVVSSFYDSAGRLIQTTDATGATTIAAYDEAGQQFCTVGPLAYAAGVRCPAQPPSSPPTRGADPYLGATIRTFDDQARLVQVTNPLGGIALYSYDLDGNRHSQTVESDNATAAPDVVTTYTYDADNHETSSAVAAGTGSASTTLQSYDPDGHVYCLVTAGAYQSGSYSCPTWQPGWIASPPNPAVLYGNGGAALHVATSFYDVNGRLVQQSNPDAATTVNAYDANGRQYCSSPPVDATTWLNSNPTAAFPYLCPTSPPTSPPTPGSNPGYETRIYDAANRIASDSDPNGDTTRMTYDAVGQPLQTTDANGNVTLSCYFWETSGCAKTSPARGGAASALYSRTTPPSAADPTGQRTVFTYWPGGLVHTKATPSGTETETYDAAGRPTTVKYSTPAAGYGPVHSTTYTYWPGGARKTMSDGSGKTSYKYDHMSDLVSASFTPAAGSPLTAYSLAYRWFATGALASLQYPAMPTLPKPVVTYAYGPNGNMTSLTDWSGRSTAFGYDADGHNTTTALPNGITESASFDLGGTPTSTAAAPAATPSNSLATITYQPNAADLVGSEGDAGALTGSFTYQYDSAGRLSMTSGATDGYDAAGNPTQLAAGGTQSFDAADELVSSNSTAGSTSFGYDSLGDRTSVTPSSGPATTYGYDQASHLVSDSQSGSTFTYNGDGIRVASTTQGVSQTFVYDVREGTSTPALLADGTNEYVYGPDQRLVEVASGTSTLYALTDYLHAPRLLTDASGAVAGASSYDPVGNLVSHTGTSLPIGFGGGYASGASLVYFIHRFFDSSTATFLTVDPALGATHQPYTFAGDDPVNGSDPSGLCDWWNVICDAGQAVGWVNNNVVQPVVNVIGSGLQSLVNLALSPIINTVQSFINSIESTSVSPAAMDAVIGAANGCAPASGSPTASPLEAVAAVSSSFRLPDYVSLEISGGDWGVVGGVVATATKYGSIFVGPELGAGIPGISGNLEAGWVDCGWVFPPCDLGGVPSRDYLNGFVSNLSFTAGGYIPLIFGVAGPAAAEVWGNPFQFGWANFSTQVGIGVGGGKNLALVASWSFHVSDSGPRW